LEVLEGEWLAITGPNGSGKTTLALALAGLQPVRAGTLNLNGEPLAPGAEARRHVAAILQEPGSQMLCGSVIEEIASAAESLGTSEIEARARALRWAEKLGITDLDRDPATLSPGQQQLVLWAAAFTQLPSLLVADEACAHLDDQARERVVAGLEELLSHGLSVVWVTQSEAELAQADRVLELENGVLGPRSEPRGREPKTSGDFEPGLGIGRLALLRLVPGRGDVRVQVEEAMEIVIPPTGIIVVTGPNGSGKTTLLECLAGLVDRPEVAISWERTKGPESGASRDPGDDPGPLLVGERPEQLVFLERALDELIHTAVARGTPPSATRARARQILDTLGIASLANENRRMWSLSTGEKRLVALVAALLSPSNLLLLDEPTAGLDRNRCEVMANLVQLRATRSAVVIATQDLLWAGGLAGAWFYLGTRDHGRGDHRDGRAPKSRFRLAMSEKRIDRPMSDGLAYSVLGSTVSPLKTPGSAPQL
jgi:energy-coupling factor transport system ATP-binding protein